MQVDCDNFQILLPQIIKNITDSDFISFDCQFSGLITCLDRIQGIFPNQIQFYQRIKQTSQNFSLFQIGITTFLYVNNEYQPKVYNFYINPSAITPNKNKIMLCQVQSMEFLAKNGIDFTRVFTKGIKSNRLKINNNHIKDTQLKIQTKFNYNSIYFTQADKKILKEIEEVKISQILKQNKQQDIIDFTSKNILIYFRNKYQQLSINDKPKKNMNQFEFLVRKRLFQKEEFKNNQNNIDFKLEGFQIVIKKIIESKKPIIGHFPNLDLGLIYFHLIDDLPQYFHQFCDSLNNLFPYIFDTKIISRRIQSKLKNLKVDLGSIFKACFNDKLLKNYTNVNFEQCEKYLKSESYHQAGYDSFITGCGFIGMINYLLQQKNRIIFEYLDNENKIIYSRFTGEIFLKGPHYCPQAEGYNKTIIIGQKSTQQDQSHVAEILSKFGTLSLYEDHDEIYYVFEKQQNIQEILYLHPFLKLLPYSKRKIIRANKIFK